MSTLHSIPITFIDGTDADFGRFKGEVVLVVNVASHCGFTPQYAGLEALLVDRNGSVVERFAPGTAPDSPEVVIAVRAALA